jgi:hemerythrin-like domain-containing protein
MMNPVAAWHQEHAYFNRLLALLEREVHVFHTGARPNYALMLDIISYLREYGDQRHHPREDAAFARLAQKCPDLEFPLARLQQQHRIIAHAGETLSRYLSDAVAGAYIQRAEIEVAAATYLVYYYHHIGREEEDVLTRAEQVLTAEDWEAVKGAIPASTGDPESAVSAEERYRELRREIALIA